MSGNAGRVLRVIAAVLVVGFVAAFAFVAAAWLADRVSAQSDEVVQPPVGAPVEVPGPMRAGDEPTADGQVDAAIDPGAVVSLEEAAPAVDGLPGAAWVLPVDLVAAGDASGETPATTETPATETPATGTPAPSDASGATTGTTMIPADQAASTAEQLGAASMQPPLTATRFVDRCTEDASPCPLGVAATVTPLSDDTSPGKLAIRVWPGLTKALVPGLRCDPGLASPSVLPVLVTANAPLDSLELTLELPDGTVLSSVHVGPSSAETALIESWVKAGLTPGTDLDKGAHFCAALPTLGDPGVAAALQAAGKTAPVPLAYRLRAVARAPVDPVSPNTPPQEATAVVDVPVDAVPNGTGGRPNTIVQPLNGHVAQVVVPERNDMTGRPTVWVANAASWRDASGLGSATAYCTKAPPGEPKPGFYDPPRPISVPPAQTYDPGLLAQASYPFDPAYTHYGVWHVVLEEATTYALCISWPLASGEEREAWTLETPNGLRFELVNLLLTPNGDQPYEVWHFRAPSVACFESFTPQYVTLPSGQVEQTEGWRGKGGAFCGSNGLPYPPVVTFEFEATYPKPYTGTGTVTDDLGSRRLVTPTWCVYPSGGPSGTELVAQAGLSGSSLLLQCMTGADDIAQSWPVTFVYFDQNVLCGSDACIEEHTRARLTTVASVGEGASNGRSRYPLDWGITGPAGDRSASPGGSAPGPSGP